MADDQPVVHGAPHAAGLGACPLCAGPMLITDHGNVCGDCDHVDVILTCDPCGAVESWRPGVTPHPTWVRLMTNDGLTATCCSGPCAARKLDQWVSDGRVSVLPRTDPGPAS